MASFPRPSARAGEGRTPGRGTGEQWASAVIDDLGAWLAEYYPTEPPTPAQVASFVIAWLDDRELLSA